jgi:hypothetical protein
LGDRDPTNYDGKSVMLSKNHNQEIAAMAGAKEVIYQAGSYRPS